MIETDSLVDISFWESRIDLHRKQFHHSKSQTAMIKYQKKTLKVGKYVNTEHINTHIRTYKKERWIHNTERLGKADSLSSWYSIEEL